MSSTFLGIYTSLFDYQAQNEEELSIQENDLLYLLEKSDVDDWWKVKKRVVDADVEEPAGLVPSTYIEPAQVISKAVALYDYDKQTEEELSFTEGTEFDIYDTSDDNWILVGINNSQFGFAPSNYIEIGGSSAAKATPAIPQEQQQQQQQQQQQPSSSTAYGATSALSSFPPPPQRCKDPSPEIEAPAPKMPTRASTIDSPTYASDDEAPPPMPTRPRGNTSSSRRTLAENSEDLLDAPTSSGNNNGFGDDFFTWNVHEIEGKKKRKCVLAIGNMSIYISFDNSSTSKEWSVKDLVSYNNEKKHVFLELKNPYASYELHAGSKDSAEAIISILTDLKSMTSMSALREVRDASMATGSSSSVSQKQGKILYDFEAASSDELTCYEGDTVIILNDKKSKEWWMVRNTTTGKQGVVPSNYIKVESTFSSGGGLKGLFTRKPSQTSLLSPKKKKSKDKLKSKDRQKEAERRYDLDVQADKERSQLQREREELERERRRQKRKEKELRDREDREKIRKADEKQRQKAISKSKSSSTKKDSSKPNPHRVRTWIDRSGAFKVEAEFLGCSDGKIHLHKINGVKIAVAAPKLSSEDLEYVERITGMSLDNYKTKKESPPPEKSIKAPTSGVTAAAPAAPKANKEIPFNEKLNDYWFDFFVQCGVDANVCDRYSRNFANEQMDEAILEDISPSLMRTLGLREGDVLRVTKFLDNKYGRNKKDEPSSVNGGLFSAADGSLKNNKAVNEVVNGSALNAGPAGHKFEDDAWASKPAAQSTEAPRPVTPQLTGSIQDLVNIKPMEPSKTGSSLNLPIKPVSSTSSAPPAPLPKDFPPMQTQKTNATVATQPTGALMAMPTGFMPITMVPMMTGQATGFMPLQATGMTINKTGQLNALPTTSFGQAQQTGSFMMPISTGLATAMPSTTFGQAQRTGGLLPVSTGFGQQKTGGILPMPLTSFGAAAPAGGMVQLQPTGLTLQKTGSLAPINPAQSFPSMQPNMRTGGGIMMPNAMTGGMLMPNAMTGGLPNAMPSTSFGQAAPMNSFGTQGTGFINTPSYTGGLSTQHFNSSLPNMNPGLPYGNTTGALPQTSFGASLPNLGQQTGGFQPQSNFGVNQLSNMFSNTSLNQQPQMQQQVPFTSFGTDPNVFQQQQSQPLASQPTGLGFGNSPSVYGQQQQQPQTSFGGLATQPTGRRANLANATADNPFGF